MLDSSQVDKIRTSFNAGTLRTRSVSSDGVVEWKRVLDTHKAEVLPETTWEVGTEYGTSTFTGGHRIYTTFAEVADAESLRVGDPVVVVVAEQARVVPVTHHRQVESRPVMYDLTIEDNHNLVLEKSRLKVHNSPDRNYHFRPPTHEGTIGCYNQVFGYIWEDDELIEYLKITLDKWNMQPPETEELCTLDAVCQRKPAWKAALLWGAVVHAAMALAFNWVADEFSVGGNSAIRVYLPDGRVIDTTMSALYEVVHEDS